MTCQGTTKAGKPCKFHAEPNGYCKHHQGQKMDASAQPKTSKSDALSLAASRRKKDRREKEEMGALPGQTLLANPKPGFHRRFVNDQGNNLDAKLRKGYSFVSEGDEPTTDIGAAKSHFAGTQKNGEPLLTYLMEIPDEFYDEDQQEKERRISDTEDSIRDASAGGDQALGSAGSRSTIYDPTKDPESNRYNPAEGSNQLLE